MFNFKTPYLTRKQQKLMCLQGAQERALVLFEGADHQSLSVPLLVTLQNKNDLRVLLRVRLQQGGFVTEELLPSAIELLLEKSEVCLLSMTLFECISSEPLTNTCFQGLFLAILKSLKRPRWGCPAQPASPVSSHVTHNHNLVLFWVLVHACLFPASLAPCTKEALTWV